MAQVSDVQIKLVMYRQAHTNMKTGNDTVLGTNETDGYREDCMTLLLCADLVRYP